MSETRSCILRNQSIVDTIFYNVGEADEKYIRVLYIYQGETKHMKLKYEDGY
jgi:hypothetical protein